MKIYYTIRADVISSTKNKKDQELFKIIDHIKANKHLINDKNILVQLTKRSGDEIFGVYSDAFDFVMTYTLLIQAAKIYKVPLSVGLGKGTLESISSHEEEVNGESIWLSTEALELVKKHIKYDERINKNLSVKIVTNQENNKAIQTILYILSEKLSKRTVDQIEAVRLVTKYPDKQYYELYNMLENTIDDQSDIDNKRIKFTKYLSRAEHLIINDLIKLLVGILKEGSWNVTFNYINSPFFRRFSIAK